MNSSIPRAIGHSSAAFFDLLAQLDDALQAAGGLKAERMREGSLQKFLGDGSMQDSRGLQHLLGIGVWREELGALNFGRVVSVGVLQVERKNLCQIVQCGFAPTGA